MADSRETIRYFFAYFLTIFFDNKTELAPVLSKFTSLLKTLYSVNFDKDIKFHFQKQISKKLVK